MNKQWLAVGSLSLFLLAGYLYYSSGSHAVPDTQESLAPPADFDRPPATSDMKASAPAADRVGARFILPDLSAATS